MSFATSTIKCLTIFFNILCCLFATLLISACSFALINFAASDVIYIPCILGVSLGCLLIFSNMLGFCGALRESLRLTWFYTILLLLLLAAQIAVNFLIPINFNKFATETIEVAWNQNLHNSDAMAAYEIQYGCCGKTGFNDYLQSGLRIPASCYRNSNSSNSADLYKTGCISKLAQAFSIGSRVEEITDWSLVGVEAATLIVACMFGINLRNKKRRELY